MTLFKSLLPRYFFALNPCKVVKVEHETRDHWGDLVSIDEVCYTFDFDEVVETDGYILDSSNMFEIYFE